MSTLVPPVNAVEISCFHTWLGPDGVCRTVAKPGAVIDLNAAKENSAAVNGFYTHKKFPLLVDARHLKSISGEARKHFSTNGRSTNITSFALIIGSPLSSIIGNFFMSLNRPHIPARLFTNESDALEWLKQHL